MSTFRNGSDPYDGDHVVVLGRPNRDCPACGRSMAPTQGNRTRKFSLDPRAVVSNPMSADERKEYLTQLRSALKAQRQHKLEKEAGGQDLQTLIEECQQMIVFYEQKLTYWLKRLDRLENKLAESQLPRAEP